ncbi:MAG: hypothetical protein ABID09_02355 [Candidatus Omnitrophota bacterium]
MKTRVILKVCGVIVASLFLLGELLTAGIASVGEYSLETARKRFYERQSNLGPGYVNDDAIRMFEEAMLLMRIDKTTKALPEESDFVVIEDALADLAQRQKEIYGEYLNRTSRTYADLAELLGIDEKRQKEILEDSMLASAANISMGAEIKLSIDVYLEGLRKKERNLLTDRELEALRLADKALEPLRMECSKMMKEVAEIFSATIAVSLKDKNNVSVSSDKNTFTALFYLNKTISFVKDTPTD